MNPVRVFAKLGAQVPPMVNMGGATGRPEIDQCDAAALCAGMPDKAYKAALCVWGGSEEAKRWLRIHLWMVAMERAQKERWQTKRLGKLPKEPTLLMAEAVIDELLDQRYHGKRDNLGEWGKGDYKWQKVGKRFGVYTEGQWRTWGPRYNRLFQYAMDLTNDAFRHVSKRQVEVN